ncbi:hypothetical protein [Thalassobacillus sp. CUG 92003]|uniref:hypothetical protein n=1 Tax=Thalassobacillus sp. CUG 92003 TaxID=2736641 RepID=UPI0015E6CB09|nr:hypothetical protein [Thalassobacillus sp. CUG 92003]
MRKIFTKSRRQRREEAREAGEPFQPRYHYGMEPKNYAEYYGGYGVKRKGAK